MSDNDKIIPDYIKKLLVFGDNGESGTFTKEDFILCIKLKPVMCQKVEPPVLQINPEDIQFFERLFKNDG